MSFEPPMPTVLDNVAVGTLLTTITITPSDGSAFTGTLGFGFPYLSDGGFCAVAGNTVILGALPPMGASTQNCTITATQ
jgi:hypothetical protein